MVLLDLGLCSENSKKTIEINRQGSDTSRFVFRHALITGAAHGVEESELEIRTQS